ncbi:putative leucine-rich repeat receptor-like serine/threonine-protein kinase At2g04300 [Nymphaea colorata]|uniref:putative leucine-rich repeat receptor-like serine/threonine-protein kinase At2g04300 n=1 Tax=Nymphaea colorata TaxID=210225 RepID=UPI00129D41EC|nr:putative leucine-rich repeat receptor-like serine/threonine-protein kinase At2g04300 [Nymphaea colorata]
MANCRRLLVPLLLVLSTVFASAQLPVNVDCGTTGKNKGYLGFTWVGDEQYVPSGQSTTVKIDDSLIAPLTTLRYFPSGKKNCYSFLGVGQGIKILVRAWFYYGNYDGLSSPPTFNVLFNGNLWSPVFMTGDNGSAILEMIHATKVDDVSVCLARTNAKDVPFINALEIKKLEADMYYSMDTDRPLHAMGRYAYASPSTNVVRYPDDPYDRLWFIFSNYASGLSPLSRSSDPLSNLADRPPAAVLRQAITPSSSLASNMTIPNLITSTSPVPHYVTFYFVEMSPNATRSFDFFLDDQRFYSNTIVPNGTVLEIFHPKVNLSTSSVFSLVRANGSALPPLISAAEFFKVGDIWAVAATDSSDVTALSALQKSYVQLQQWSGDPCLPVGYAWEWLNCSSDSTPRVTALYLGGYGLSGPLADFSNLTALQTIDLHNNSLSGSIPEFLGKLPNLQQLNLADNQFNGSVPSSLTGNSKVNLNISGNNISSGTISSSPSNSTIKSKKKTNGGVVAGAIIGSLLFLLLLVLFVIFIFKGRRTPVQLNAAAHNAKPTALLEPEIKHEFSHAEILEITTNFETVIGEGGSGNVYYGRLKNGPEVAVKVLKDSLEQGTKEFVAEVKLLMTVHHKCLVSFIGYCEEDGKLILLYEYMSGGNLRQLLSGRDSTSAFLTWQTRLQMALNVAAGLDYLHSGCYPQIIHRDVKTTNILLNAKMEAKVADFGLSKAGHKDDVTQLPTVVAGTPGYIDPEYYRTSLVTKKSDVYSFGVVLFELMTGYAPLFNVSGERFHIVEWATSRLTRGDIHSVADPRLGGQYEVNSMWKVADIAMSCTAPSSEMRPHMSDVVIQLKEAIEAESYSQQRTGNSSAEVQHSSSSYGFSSSHVSNSSLPPAR